MAELSDEEITALAQELRQEVLAGSRRKVHPRAGKASIDEAYRLQQAYQNLLETEGAGPIAGYKIALTSETMQSMVGVDHPLAGAIYESSISQGPGHIALTDFQRLGVEFEIAVKLSSDLVNIGRPHTIDTVSAAVDSIAPAFELVEDRNADYDALDACGLIAENCWNAGVILGDFIEQFDLVYLPMLETRLTIDGYAQDKAKAGDVMGHPFSVVAWVADLLISQGKQLEAGMIVMTGSSMRTRFPATDTNYGFSVQGVGTVDLHINAMADTSS